MGGIHHWSGSTLYQYYSRPDSVVYTSYDFPITILNDTTVLVGYDSSTIHYSSSNDSEIVFYEESYWDKYFYDTIANRTITFNYLNNKITFFRVIGLYPVYSDLLTLASP